MTLPPYEPLPPTPDCEPGFYCPFTNNGAYHGVCIWHEGPERTCTCDGRVAHGAQAREPVETAFLDEDPPMREQHLPPTEPACTHPKGLRWTTAEYCPDCGFFHITGMLRDVKPAGERDD